MRRFVVKIAASCLLAFSMSTLSKPSAAFALETHNTSFVVVVGTFSSSKNADQLKNSLNSFQIANFEIIIQKEKNGDLFYVSTKPFGDLYKAEAFLFQLTEVIDLRPMILAQKY